ncbi:superfamily II DNA/RNA helicase [Streptomyces sp. SAI-144]|uniref:DEAD/DEAH box helicase n=1 Tax=Streptomyces sp. SAI-144 TaxID=2940544 RepID=UPI0024739C0A|nr:DEAD/DEAH box helicase [Streptomyces sp. SAI-144]MDH6440176.1 superfamily II DNA/RNA helicase [Streptomyces sp. SAI-144]
MTLPVALSGSDVIGQAKTGTGKTLGFGLPLLERVTVPADVEAGRAKPEDLTDAPQALVVVPTRELCTQVTNDLLTAGKVRNVRVLAIYGGRAYEPQVEALKKGVDVVVGTPGRLLDLAGQKKLNLGHIKALVLDEADEMLDLGFLPDVEKIINMLPARRQTMLFSATMPGAVIGLARRYMSQPTHINATSPDDAGRTVANTKQHVYRAHNMDKPEMVARILQADGRGLVMVFCRTKRTAADLADQLQQRGFAAGAVHGDLGQGAREQALRAFRNGKVDVLVCTDVAARGIDVEGVTHVINYQSPEEEKTYLHRIGRTGRAGAKGIAITLVDWDDIPRWQLINKALELNFNDPPETYSTSPHFYEELSIPAGTKGVLPRGERTRAGLAAEELEDLGEPGGRGARGRGDRDRDRGRGRGGRDESRSADRERSERTPRRRRRTRGGTAPDVTAPAEAVAPSETTAVEDTTATRTPRRRRRTRGGASDSAPATATAAAAAVEPAVSEAAESAVTAAEGPSLGTETPAKPRRRRTRRSAETPAAVETVVETTPVTEAAPATEAAPEAEAPATKPRRTRKTAVAAPAAETAVDTAEATEAKPRRTRKAASAPAAETAADTAEGTATKPRRTRKTTTATATTEGTADTAETAEPKPRRTRKAAAPATTAAETAVDTAEATEAKPRRTRKAAATPAAEATVDTAEATEAKPRRTRKAAAPATTAAETAVDTAEATEAKPRRTRKAASAAPAAEAAVDTAEATEAKPRRRTRKAAEPAVTADIPAQAVQEPEAVEVANPRRTRKTGSSAKAAETAVDTAEGTATKPRRTRKTTTATATTEATADTAETAEAKPRRTRKAAATAEVVADTVEAKPRRRTTRKAAEPVLTADIPAQADQEPKVAAPRRRTRKTAAAEPADS